jgi:hypothetical protein
LSDWNITPSITDAIEKGIKQIHDDVNAIFIDIFKNIGSVLLDSILAFIILLLMFTGFKYMITIKKEKQEENVNMIFNLFGIYFIVKMLSVIIGK